jgi:hypothetical protein
MKFTKGDIKRKHYIDDLFIISLVYGLLYVAEDIEKQGIQKDGMIKKKFEYSEGYKEMLDEIISNIKNELHTFMMRREHVVVAKQVKEKVNTRLPEVLKIFEKENVSLEVLAMYILYYNFVNREVLHENFKPLTEKEKYSIVVDTLDSAGFKLLDKIKMHRLAKDALLRIK